MKNLSDDRLNDVVSRYNNREALQTAIEEIVMRNFFQKN